MAERKESRSPLDITIVGAGLAGLSAAISCSLAGHNVLVTESAKELAEVGHHSLGLERRQMMLMVRIDRRRPPNHPQRQQALRTLGRRRNIAAESRRAFLLGREEVLRWQDTLTDRQLRCRHAPEVQCTVL